MGIEYEMVNTKTRKRFELGKGLFFVPELVEAVTGPNPIEATTKVLLEVITVHWDWSEGDQHAYCVDLATRLVAFVDGASPAELLMVDDCDDEAVPFALAGWPLVDTRYTSLRRTPLSCCGSTAVSPADDAAHTFTCKKAREEGLPYEENWVTLEDAEHMTRSVRRRYP